LDINNCNIKLLRNLFSCKRHLTANYDLCQLHSHKTELLFRKSGFSNYEFRTEMKRK
jgi:hypothetical protein